MRYLLRLQYIGTRYHGWQVQTNAPAVQPLIQDALEAVFGHRPGVSGCSRTDSGVHANEYFCHFDSNRELTPYRILCAMNKELPEDVAVTDCRIVPPDFHARYSVKGKEYVYRILNTRHRRPMEAGRAYHYRYPLDAEGLDRAARDFVGTHDFSAFCAMGAKEGDRRRTVTDARVERQGDMVIFRVSADGFLYNMVRIMVGTLLRISEGKIPPDGIPAIIASKDRGQAGPTAPAEGLYLNHVYYE